jgi:hypothetical protein
MLRQQGAAQHLYISQDRAIHVRQLHEPKLIKNRPAIAIELALQPAVRPDKRAVLDDLACAC